MNYVAFQYRLFFFLLIITCSSVNAQQVYLRINQLGYQPTEQKVALAFSQESVSAEFYLKNTQTDAVLYQGMPTPSPAPTWGAFNHYYEFDFSEIKEIGNYYLEWNGERSASFPIGSQMYNEPRKDLLTFMDETLRSSPAA